MVSLELDADDLSAAAILEEWLSRDLDESLYQDKWTHAGVACSCDASFQEQGVMCMIVVSKNMQAEESMHIP
jgi:hypothetical protein